MLQMVTKQQVEDAITVAKTKEMVDHLSEAGCTPSYIADQVDAKHAQSQQDLRNVLPHPGEQPCDVPEVDGTF